MLSNKPLIQNLLFHYHDNDNINYVINHFLVLNDAPEMTHNVVDRIYGHITPKTAEKKLFGVFRESRNMCSVTFFPSTLVRTLLFETLT